MEVNIVPKIFCDCSIAKTLISAQILVHGVFSGKFLQILSYVGYGCYILKGPEPMYWLTSCVEDFGNAFRVFVELRTQPVVY